MINYLEIELEEIIGKEAFIKIGGKGHILRPGLKIMLQYETEETEEEKEIDSYAKKLADSFFGVLK